jgi:hypothetical protein
MDCGSTLSGSRRLVNDVAPSIYASHLYKNIYVIICTRITFVFLYFFFSFTLYVSLCVPCRLNCGVCFRLAGVAVNRREVHSHS